MSTNLQKNIIKLASDGLSNTTIASTLNVSPSYVSEVCSTNSEVIFEANRGKTVDALGRDDKWDKLEDMALDKMSNLLESDNEIKPELLLKVLNSSNMAKRKVSNIGGEGAMGQMVTLLSLPPYMLAAMEYQGEVLNRNNQIIEANGVELETISPDELNKMLVDKKGRNV
jgi:predicted transcriptional regulator